MTTAPVVTIDGPSGSGKGTVARCLSNELGWAFLDSGALYRVLGLHAERLQVALDDESAIAALADTLPVRFAGDAEQEQILLNEVDVTDTIRTEHTGSLASQVAALPAVRAALLARQRAFRRAPGLVADGRDMGTVVFPNAEVKVFLTASAEERARRRYKQLNEKGLDVNLSTLLREIEVRDRRDASRAVAPLVPAEDAQVIDTTELSIDAVVEQLRELVRNRLPGLGGERL